MYPIDDLYQQLILDHSAKPHHFGVLDHPTHQAEGTNPLCGDQVTLFLNIQNNLLMEVRFTGAGCAICTASASIMTDCIQSKTVSEMLELFQLFHSLLTSEQEIPFKAQLGKAQALENVKHFPIRVKCATLPWHTLKAALLKEGHQTTTE